MDKKLRIPPGGISVEDLIDDLIQTSEDAEGAKFVLARMIIGHALSKNAEAIYIGESEDGKALVRYKVQGEVGKLAIKERSSEEPSPGRDLLDRVRLLDSFKSLTGVDNYLHSGKVYHHQIKGADKVMLRVVLEQYGNTERMSLERVYES